MKKRFAMILLSVVLGAACLNGCGKTDKGIEKKHGTEEQPRGEMSEKSEGEAPRGEMPEKPEGEPPEGEMPEKPEEEPGHSDGTV